MVADSATRFGSDSDANDQIPRQGLASDSGATEQIPRQGLDSNPGATKQ